MPESLELARKPVRYRLPDVFIPSCLDTEADRKPDAKADDCADHVASARDDGSDRRAGRCAGPCACERTAGRRDRAPGDVDGRPTCGGLLVDLAVRQVRAILPDR